MKFFSIRKNIYKHNLSEAKNRGENLIDMKHPYTSIKSIYYIETASLFLFLTQKVIKSPNFITLLYILCGVMGAFFIVLNPHNLIFYLGLFMVFTKGTFDWADGPLARRLNKTSFLGHALDVYGANVGDAAFRIAFVFYALTNYPEYMFLFPLFSFAILIPRFNVFSDFLYLQKIEKDYSDSNKKKIISKFKEGLRQKKKMNKILKLYNIYISFLDERARGVDFLLLILLFDKISDKDITFLILILSILIILRASVKYFATTYLAYKTYKDK